MTGIVPAGGVFTEVDWEAVHPTTHDGVTGFATWRTVWFGSARVRIVEYSPGYVADHWCSKGHIIQVLRGELVTERQETVGIVTGSRAAGQMYICSDDTSPHRSSAPAGATLLIVD